MFRVLMSSAMMVFFRVCGKNVHLRTGLAFGTTCKVLVRKRLINMFLYLSTEFVIQNLKMHQQDLVKGFTKFASQ